MLRKNLLWLITLCLPLNSAAVPEFRIPSGQALFRADYIEYDQNEEFIFANGNIEVIIDKFTITSNSIIYDLQKDHIWAEGNVRIKESGGKTVLAEKVIFKDRLKSGVISDFVLKFSKDNVILASRLAARISENHLRLEKSVFTPCSITCNSKPIWQISAEETDLNFDREKITYRNVFFEVYGVPILFTPYFSHATPDAKAQSGLLVPLVTNNQLVIPFYFRTKPNMDFTLSPRIAEKYAVFELQGRHKLTNGYYQIDGSYGKVPYKNRKINSAYFSLYGNFFAGNWKYGFDIKHTSDKAYLKNYLNSHEVYLPSKIYLNKIQNYNYFILEAIHFQGLSANDSSRTDPLILPKIKTKNIIDLDDEGSTYFVIKNDIISYQEYTKKIDRGSLDLSLINNFTSYQGHMFTQTLKTRGDLYFAHNGLNNGRKLDSRTIPELHSAWRYPLIKYFNTYSIILEPVISAIIGRRARPSDKEFHLIDPYRCDITENNLFVANHYSGIDYYESGNRASYGINIASLVNNNYYDIFIGQFIHSQKMPNNSQKGNVGRFSIRIHEAMNLFYQYKYDARFKP
ncbi:MAG: LPS-assembly protein LptD, partial [Janthinobacterium lividum]